VGIVSFWSKWATDVETVMNVFAGNYPAGGAAGVGPNIYRSGGFSMYFDGYVSAGTRALIMQSVGTGGGQFKVANGWRHVMASWNLATAAKHLYVDGADALQAGGTYTNDNIDYTQSNYCVGAFTDGANKVNCCLSDFYFNSAEYIDLSDAGNRAKFYNSGPVSLGSDGSLPTGTAPIVYLKGDDTNFQTNAGTGGNFTVTGALTSCTAPP
jgi:hypothetical protein